MTEADFKKHFDAVFTELRQTIAAGQSEYAHGQDDNVFNNFIRVGGQVDLPPEKVLWVYLSKHLDGISAYLKGHRSQREPVQGRIKDAIIYLMILWAMVDEEETSIDPAANDARMITREQAEGMLNSFGLGKRTDLMHDKE